MTDSDRILQRAEAALRRHGSEPRLAQRARQRQRAGFFRKLGRVAMVAGGLVIGLPLWGLMVGPVGTTGLMLAVLAVIVAAVAIMLMPNRNLGVENVPTTDLARLPLRTEEWLSNQRAALPAPAARLVDGIGVKLEMLAPQLQALNDKEPAAFEIRRLIADELPELINGYARVPHHLRAEGLNGMSPDKQLVDGLAVVDSELARMSEQLAAGDLNKLATQGRYLEIKYQGDVGG
ncbi:MAG: hypothetical protein ABL918_02530 [Chakrabartia sp.]